MPVYEHQTNILPLAGLDLDDFFNARSAEGWNLCCYAFQAVQTSVLAPQGAQAGIVATFRRVNKLAKCPDEACLCKEPAR